MYILTVFHNIKWIEVIHISEFSTLLLSSIQGVVKHGSLDLIQINHGIFSNHNKWTCVKQGRISEKKKQLCQHFKKKKDKNIKKISSLILVTE